jgi:hypothetical protein
MPSGDHLPPRRSPGVTKFDRGWPPRGVPEVVNFVDPAWAGERWRGALERLRACGRGKLRERDLITLNLRIAGTHRL